jgi:hypothetical protein
LNLSEGIYLWNVYCNDSTGNLIGASNQSFIVDLSNPVVELLEPTGTKDSKSDIPLTFSVNDTSSVKCEFDVSLVDSGTTFSFELDECQNVKFNVAIEADYETSLKVEDSVGNTEYRSSEFEVDPETAEANEPESEEAGEEILAIAGDASLFLTELKEVIIRRGESEFLTLEVLNDGNKFLNGCKLFGTEILEDWISSSQVEDLSSGQKVDYIFNLNVPLTADSGKYSSDILIDCEEISEKTNLDVEIEGLDFEIFIRSSKKIGNKLVIDYTIEEFSGNEQEISISYSLINLDGLEIYAGEEMVNLEPGKNNEFTLEFELPKDSIGEFELVFKASNGMDEITKKMGLVLSAKGLSGFAISEDNLRILSWFGGFILILFSFYFVFKFLRKHKKIMSSSEKKQFIDLDFDE